MRHLTAADYRVMPWANGKGTTTELWREDRDGAMLWRLSRANVVEDGQFSLFPGINRNLTVLSGPGFDLVAGDLHLPAHPLQPVAFAGNLAIRAVGVAGPSDDFNVMVSTSLPPPVVTVTAGPRRLVPPLDGIACLYALDLVSVADLHLQPGDLVMSRMAFDTGAGRAVTVLITDERTTDGQ